MSDLQQEYDFDLFFLYSIIIHSIGLRPRLAPGNPNSSFVEGQPLESTWAVSSPQISRSRVPRRWFHAFCSDVTKKQIEIFSSFLQPSIQELKLERLPFSAPTASSLFLESLTNSRNNFPGLRSIECFDPENSTWPPPNVTRHYILFYFISQEIRCHQSQSPTISIKAVQAVCEYLSRSLYVYDGMGIK